MAHKTWRSLLILIAALLTALAAAHPANVAAAQVKVLADGSYTLRVRFDVLALATGSSPTDADDGAMNALLDGPEDALKTALADGARRFSGGFAALADGKPADAKIAFATVADVRRFLAEAPSPRLPVMLTVTVAGKLPSGAKALAFRYPALLGSVIQTVEFPYREPFSEPVEGGVSSTALPIPTSAEIAKLKAEMERPRETTAVAAPKAQAAPKPLPKAEKPKSGERPAEKERGKDEERTTKVETEKPSTERASPHPLISHITSPEPPSPPQPPSPTSAAPNPSSLSPLPFGASLLTYLRMGFRHIVPQGLDHILFVLGLFLLGTRTKALLTQITAFTVAHSITLALTALGVIHLPARIIEPTIAISIAFVAIENLFAKDVRPWRTAVVFAFGLVHGMGFAEVFADAGLRGRSLIEALLGFNVGVELGQLTVVALAFAAVGWLRSSARYRPFVVVPGSLAIAAVALVWTVQRLMG